MEKLPSIGITIPTWRRGKLFEQSVHSLLEQDYPGHIEIMCVVDHEYHDSAGHVDVHPAGGCSLSRYKTPSDLYIAHNLEYSARRGGILDWKPDGECFVKTPYAGLRSVRIKRGPGYSNWRPGAIHFPVFEHWIQTKCDYVGYQFSDEYSHPSRIGMQVMAMRGSNALWSYCGNTHIIDPNDRTLEIRTYNWTRGAVGSNTLMTPTILVNRNAFEAAGGLDYPIHAAAKAEIWIQTYCAVLGNPAVWRPKEAAYYFIHHDESLGNDQRPGSLAYKEAIDSTGFLEEDHWRLWNRIAHIHDNCARRAREQV